MADDTSTSPIVVGVDGSESSVAALRRARDLARALDRSVTAITAWRLPVFYGGGPLAYDWDPAGDAKLALEDAIVDAYGEAHPAGVVQEVVEGNPAEVLVERSEHAHLVVVGSRGHGGFSGLLLGSVSSAVAEHASCPVLVVH